MKRGTAPPATHAPTPKRQNPRCGGARQRRHYDTSEPVRRCARATPAIRRPAPSQCRLKVFSQATTGGPLRRHGVGSRFPLKMEPGADDCGSGRMYVAFSLAWLKPPLELLQTGVNLHRKARAPVPAPRWSRRTTALLHAPCSSKRAPVLPLRQGDKLASAHYERPSGWLPTTAGNGRATPIQSQRSCSHAN